MLPVTQRLFPHPQLFGHSLEWGRLVVATLARAIIVVILGLAFWSAAPAVLGWYPTTVMTGSMEPRLSPGDIIISRPVAPETLAIGQVLLADDPDKVGALRLHRYSEAGVDGQLITKGDANPSADSTPIERSAVLGVAVIRVPSVGLPILWIRAGQWQNLILLVAALTVIAALTQVDRSLRRPASTAVESAQPDPTGGRARNASGSDGARRRARRRETRSGRLRRIGLGGTAFALVCGFLLSNPTQAIAASFASSTANRASTLSAASTFDCLGRTVAYNPSFSYQFAASTGSTETDASGNGRTGTLSAGVKRTAGDCTNSPYVTLDGSSGQVSAASAPRITSPTTFSLESWIRTSAAGGDIISFGDSQNGTSTVYDRSLFIGSDGRAVFGVFTGERTTISSRTAVNDGKWHHIIATLSSAGSRLYIDGAQVGSSTGTSSQNFSGWWRIGQDSLSLWPNAPANDSFRGDFDDTTVYPVALSASQVTTLYQQGR